MKIRQILKYLFFIVSILAVLIICAVITIPFLISTDAIRIRLAQDLSVWTGYNVQLREPPKISFFPKLQAALSGVTLSDASDDSNPLMDAERIEVDLSLIDALQGKVSFAETRIIRPHLSIDEPVKTVAGFFGSLSRSDGRLGIAIREAHDILQQDPNSKNLSRLSAQPFGRILIEDGTLFYPLDSHSGAKNKPNDEQNKRGEITQINSTLTWPATIDAVVFRSTATWNGAYTDVTLRADQALIFMAGGKSNIRLSINSNRGGITFTGQAQFAQSFTLVGQIAARSPAFNVTMDWLGLSKNFGAGIQSPLVWQSSLNAMPEKLELNNINLTLGNDKARGALEMDFTSKLLSTTGSIAFQTLDFDQILPAFMPAGDVVPDLSFLDRFSLDLRVSTPEGQIGGINLENFAASTQLRNGRLIFDIGNANVFDGLLQSNTTMGLVGNVIQLDTRLSTTNVSLEQVAAALNVTAKLKCPINMTMTATSNFTQWSKLFLNAKGAFDVNCSNGTITGVDYTRINDNLLQNVDFDVFSKDEDVFNFNRLAAKGKIDNNNIITDIGSIAFDSHLISFSGKNSLNGDMVDMLAAIDKPQRVNGRCIDVQCLQLSLQMLRQFKIKGAWNNLKAQQYISDNQ